MSGPGLHNLAVSQTAKVARAEPHQRRRTVRTRRWTVVFRCAERVHREPRTGLLRRKSGVEVSIAERGSHPARADTEASVEALFADCDARRQQLGQQRPQGRPEGKHSRSAPCRSPPPSRRRSSSRRPRRRRGYSRWTTPRRGRSWTSCSWATPSPRTRPRRTGCNRPSSTRGRSRGFYVACLFLTLFCSLYQEAAKNQDHV